MLDEGNEFECECGQFAHMGLLCRHVLKVLDFIRAKEIPAKHIVKEVDEGCSRYIACSPDTIPERQYAEQSILV